VIDAAARRQKWIDQAQSVNLWLKTPDLKTLSHMYRSAWHGGLKTTYYLRTLGASNIEKATVSVKKEVRGAAGETKAETATRDTRDANIATAAATALAAATEISSLGSTPPIASTGGSASTPATSAPKKTYSAEEKRVCSIEAMKNGEECEACQ
jgi:ribonucleoside-diphosphate reductase alpha chain